MRIYSSFYYQDSSCRRPLVFGTTTWPPTSPPKVFGVFVCISVWGICMVYVWFRELNRLKMCNMYKCD